MMEKGISRTELLRRLRRTAQVRAIVTMLSVFPLLLVAAVVFGDAAGEWGMAAVFGGPMIVCWLFTAFYCKRAVRCPHCGGSLWHCGTGNFKVRRMKIRPNATGCPHCRARFV